MNRNIFSKVCVILLFSTNVCTGQAWIKKLSEDSQELITSLKEINEKTKEIEKEKGELEGDTVRKFINMITANMLEIKKNLSVEKKKETIPLLYKDFLDCLNDKNFYSKMIYHGVPGNLTRKKRLLKKMKIPETFTQEGYDKAEIVWKGMSLRGAFKEILKEEEEDNTIKEKKLAILKFVLPEKECHKFTGDDTIQKFWSKCESLEIKEKVKEKIDSGIAIKWLLDSVELLEGASEFKSLQLYEAKMKLTGSGVVTFKLWVPPMDNSEKFINQIVRRFFVFYQILSSFFPNVASRKEFTWYIVPTEVKKKFPTGQPVIFASKDVNSAFTDVTKGICYFYRKEEFAKVALHEFCHAFGLDKFFFTTNETLEKKFAVEPSGLQVNEGIIEALACLANVILTAYENNENGDEFDENQFQQDLKEMWAMEKRFATYQSAKILHLSGFENSKKFTSPETTKVMREKGVATVEYHIFKAMFLQYVDQFLEIIDLSKKERKQESEKMVFTEHPPPPNFGESYVSMKKKDIQKKITNFLLGKLDFFEKVDVIIGAFKSNSDLTKGPLYKTGRMTIIEQRLSLETI